MRIRLTKNLEPLRASALARLDDKAASLLADSTPPAIAEVRAQKWNEAARIMASDEELDPATVPLLARESADKGMPIRDIAFRVFTQLMIRSAALVDVEAARQAAQTAIREAATPAAIEAALEGFHG